MFKDVFVLRGAGRDDPAPMDLIPMSADRPAHRENRARGTDHALHGGGVDRRLDPPRGEGGPQQPPPELARVHVPLTHHGPDRLRPGAPRPPPSPRDPPRL